MNATTLTQADIIQGAVYTMVKNGETISVRVFSNYAHAPEFGYVIVIPCRKGAHRITVRPAELSEVKA